VRIFHVFNNIIHRDYPLLIAGAGLHYASLLFLNHQVDAIAQY
jgi:hypothetical protein